MKSKKKENIAFSGYFYIYCNSGSDYSTIFCKQNGS